MENTDILIIIIASIGSFMLGVKKGRSNCFCLSCSFERDSDNNLQGIKVCKKSHSIPEVSGSL